MKFATGRSPSAGSSQLRNRPHQPPPISTTLRQPAASASVVSSSPSVWASKISRYGPKRWRLFRRSHRSCRRLSSGRSRHARVVALFDEPQPQPGGRKPGPPRARRRRHTIPRPPSARSAAPDRLPSAEVGADRDPVAAVRRAASRMTRSSRAPFSMISQPGYPARTRCSSSAGRVNGEGFTDWGPMRSGLVALPRLVA